jgi:hypothetical protein
MRRVPASFAALLIAGLASAAASQTRASFAVGSASAAPGQKATGVLAVPAGVDAALDIPVAVVHGARPGPVLAHESGAHRTE